MTAQLMAVEVVESTPQMTFQEAIGASLRGYRHRCGLLLKQVAGGAGISVGHLCEIERGESRAGSEVLRAICEALEISQAYIMKDSADRLELNELLQGETS